MDDLHFVSRKKKAQFKVKVKRDLLIINTRETTKEVDVLLKKNEIQIEFHMVL